MKKLILSLLFVFGGLSICFGYSPIIDGALISFKIRVVDDLERPVEDATVVVSFFTTPMKVSDKMGKTDKNGDVEIRGDCIGEVSICVSKQGYYETNLMPSVQVLSMDKVRRLKKWSDKPVPLRLVLKRIVNPVNLKFNRANCLNIPITNAVMFLDLEELKWCPPYGNGKNADVKMFYESWQNPTNWLSYHRKLTVGFPSSADGFYVAKKEAFSTFSYAYHAETNKTYLKTFELELDRRTGTITKETFFADDDYLVLRVRSVTNEYGQVVEANYGRIGEKCDHMFGLRMKTWFNPTPNDTNLEDSRTAERSRKMQRSRGQRSR